jgi:hypothetical protein
VTSRLELAQLWNESVELFLEGGQVHPPTFTKWFESCRGSGRTEVSTTCFPEPFIGDLTGKVKAIILGLNPGRPFPELQARNGIYADAIRTAGSYTAWASSWPYLSEAWTSFSGKPNPFHKARYDWVQGWTGECSAPSESHLVVELYPWHSIDLPQPFEPDIDSINRYVWEPLAEFGPLPIFAFGSKSLFGVIPNLPGVEVLARLPESGETAATYGFSAPSREVMIGRAPTGGLLYIANHHGSDRLPPLSELDVHRELARRIFGKGNGIS